MPAARCTQTQRKSSTTTTARPATPRRILAEHGGHEPGDPARVAAAILRIADAEAPPLQLLLGADAMHYATRQLARFQTGDRPTGRR